MIKKYSLKFGICLGFLLLITPIIKAFAAGILDPLFGNLSGYIELEGSHRETSVQSDGRILVMVRDAQFRDQLIRVLQDGSIDTYFGINGFLAFPSDLGMIASTTPDGKIIVVGKCTFDNFGWPNTDISLQRLLSNGQPDPSFNDGNPVCRSTNATGNYFFVSKVLIQPDGKILVLAIDMFAGDFIGGHSLLARFDIHGNIDATFGTGGIFVPEVPNPPGGSSLRIENVAIQSDGTLLLVGTVSNWRNPRDVPVYLVAIRLTTSGQYDTGFNSNGVFIYYHPTSDIHSCDIVIQQSGRIIIEGSEDTSEGVAYFLLGLTDNGTIDTSFGNSGLSIIPEVACELLLLPDDSIVTGGFADPAIIVTVFNANGDLNTSFANGGSAAYDFLGSLKSLAMQPSGKIIITGGSYTDNKTFIARIGPIFGDVNFSYWANSFIERLYIAGITSGCNTSPLMYCPSTTVTRDQMAVFLLRAKHASSYVPNTATGVFQDVPINHWAASWIEQLAAEGITSGCSVSPKQYCPSTPVTRDQMAVFLLRAKHGSEYVPPEATGEFTDVDPDYWAADWIEQLAKEGITSGCSVTPKMYCPTTPVTRDQMAVFLVRNFSLP